MKNLAAGGARPALQGSFPAQESAETILNQRNANRQVHLLLQILSDAAAQWSQECFHGTAAPPSRSEQAQMLSAPARQHVICGKSIINETAIMSPSRIHPGGIVERKRSSAEAIKFTNDEKINVCGICGCGFGFLQRQHHCRSCSRLVCHACSSKSFPMIDATEWRKIRRRAGIRSDDVIPKTHEQWSAKVRVCDGCFNALQGLDIRARKEQSYTSYSRSQAQ